MTNSQARSYGIIALRNLVKAGVVPGRGDMFCEFANEIELLFDELGETEAEKKAAEILRGHE